MEKYDILLDGLPVTVITAHSAPRTSREGASGYTVYVYPVSDADVGATCIDKNDVELREPHLPLAALYHFFKEVRHLPDVTLDVMIGDKVYELSLAD